MEDIKKKGIKQKRSFEKNFQNKRTNTFPILGHIVLSNGCRVDIPKLPTCSYPLTIYDHLRIALGNAAILLSIAQKEESRSIPKLLLKQDWDVIRLNSEDLLNHLHYAIEGFHNETGSS